MLEIADLTVEIQNSEILRGVSFNIAAGELVCLVGRNGAGKTTTLRTIMGYIVPRSGAIRLAGSDLSGKSTLERARRAGLLRLSQSSPVWSAAGNTFVGWRTQDAVDRAHARP
jgi:ABC-type branched-subunit amino acid transport system ATPase component